MICTSSPWTEMICPFLLSMRGTWTLVLTGPTRDFLAPVKMLAASMLAFAEPCFPGLEVDMEMILQGSSSMLTYLPTFSSLISFISQSAISNTPHVIRLP